MCLYVLAAILLIAISIYSYDSLENIQRPAGLDMNMQEKQNPSPSPDINDSDTGIHRPKDVQDMLDRAWQDIKTTFNIDESQYVKFDIGDFEPLSKGEYAGFKNGEQLQSILQASWDLIHNQPKGSTIPVILLKRDASEAVVCFKESDGTNVYRQAIKKEDKWDISEKKAPGKPIE
jgi:hypothetical protein